MLVQKLGRPREKLSVPSMGSTCQTRPAGAVVGPFQILDAVSNNVVKAGYAWGNYWSGKNSAFVL